MSANKHRAGSVLWAIAVASFILGIILTVVALADIRRCLDRLKAQGDNMRELVRLQSMSAKQRAAVAMFGQLPDPHPVPMTQLLKDVLPGENYETKETPAGQAADGWILKKIEVSFAEIELGRLSGFLARVETLRPPWRLTACTIRSLNQTGGTGQVTLELQALDKE